MPFSSDKPLQPAYIRGFNQVGAALSRSGLVTPSLAPDKLIARALRKTGLTDFGDPGFRKGLELLTEGLEQEAELSQVGRIVARYNLVDHLCVRLQLIDYRKHRPEVAAENITRPLFILGLPRTGTTILFELIAQDPAMRSPANWEVSQPLPPPQGATFHSDPRIRQVAALLPILEKLTPGFRKIHAIGAQLPQECVYLQASQFLSEQFSYMYELPTYRHWLLQQDMSPSYRWHRQFLQHLQVDCPRDHWVLKSPAHLPHLDALLEQYPDAAIVWTHRQPLQAIASFSSLASTLQGGFSREIDPQRTGRLELQHHAKATNMAMDKRQQLEPTQFLDISFDSICEDPLAVIQTIYTHFGYELTAEAEQRMRDYLTRRPRDLYGEHRYTAAEFGLDENSVNGAFGRYLGAFKRFL